MPSSKKSSSNVWATASSCGGVRSANNVMPARLSITSICSLIALPSVDGTSYATASATVAPARRPGQLQPGARAAQRAIRRPRRHRSHGQEREAEQDVVEVDAPAGEVSPGLVAVGLQRNAGLLETRAGFVELVTRDADRVVGRGIGVERDAEVLRDAPQGEVA